MLLEVHQESSIYLIIFLKKKKNPLKYDATVRLVFFTYHI